MRSIWLEKVTGYGGSLESTLFDSIADKLFEIRRIAGEASAEAALELWTSLYDAFKRLHENAADYIASLQTAKAEEVMVAETFLVFKDRLTSYLQNFIQALQRSAYKIEGNLERIGDGVRDFFLDKVIEAELGKPRLEEAPSREALLAEYRQGWANLQRWFLGDGLRRRLRSGHCDLAAGSGPAGRNPIPFRTMKNANAGSLKRI